MPDPASPVWAAPVGVSPVDACVRVPGSKSATARALFLAAIADQPTRIVGALSSRDTALMSQALQALGAGVVEQPDGAVVVSPIAQWSEGKGPEGKGPEGMGPEGEVTIHTGLAGTVMRFVPLLAALRPGATHFVGDPEAEPRPLGPVLDVARHVGARVEYHGEEGHLPFTVWGVDAQAPTPTELPVVASASSQFLSATLLVAPLLALRDGMERRVRAVGPVVSLPHIEMTCDMLRQRGVRVDHPSAAEWRVFPGRPRGGQVSIEPDLTNAGVFLAAAMLCGGQMVIPDWPMSTTQAGDAWREFFTRLRATVSLDTEGLRLVAPESFPGVDMDFEHIGELTPTAVAVLLFARTPSSIRGVEHIRGHETDRLAALATEIRAMGGEVRERPDGLDITPVAHLQAANLQAYADHRMATFAALVGLRVPGVTVDDIGATSKTLPDFPALWAGLFGHGLPPVEQHVEDHLEVRGEEGTRGTS